MTIEWLVILGGVLLGIGVILSIVITNNVQKRRYQSELSAALAQAQQNFLTERHQLEINLQQERMTQEQLRVTLAQEKLRCEELQARANYLSETLYKSQSELAVAHEKSSQFSQVAAALASTQRELSDVKQAYSALEGRADQEKLSLTEQVALLQNARTDLTKEFENLATKIFDAKQQQFTQTSKTALDTTLDPLRQQLTDFRKKVEDVYEKENADRNRLSGQVVELQKQAQKIGEDAVNLAQALKGNTKSQGNWGEVVLERLLEESGLRKGHEYSTQVNLTNENGLRLIPDVIIHLPENKDIVIDAKCSLVHYERYCSSDDEVERKQFLEAHIQSIRNHLKNLSIKDYERLPGLRSLDFVFIFIPIEAAFLLAFQEAPSLYREAYDRHIILVSPTTLLATLRTVDNIWRYEKQNKNAEKIAADAGSLHDQFVLVLESLESLGASLAKTQETYAKTCDRLYVGRGNLVKRINDIKVLGAKTKKTLSITQKTNAGIDIDSTGSDVVDINALIESD